MHRYMHICLHLCIYMHTSVHMHNFVHMHAYACAYCFYARICTVLCICTESYIYACIYTEKNAIWFYQNRIKNETCTAEKQCILRYTTLYHHKCAISGISHTYDVQWTAIFYISDDIHLLTVHSQIYNFITVHSQIYNQLFFFVINMWF